VTRAPVAFFAVGAALLAGGTVSARPSGTVQVNATQGSTTGKPLVILAGSAKWLVFEQADPANSFPKVKHVVVRSASGKVRTLPHSGGQSSWQASGHVILGFRRPFPNTPVTWWDLSSGKSGHATFGNDQTSIGVTPDGYAYLTGNHRVHLVHVGSGDRTSFKGVAFAVAYAFTTPRGIVYETKHHGDWYQKFAGRHPVHRIHIPTRPGDAYFSACYSRNAHYLGCWHGYDDDDSNAADSVELIPLDGGKPQVTSTNPGEPALAGDSAVWATGNTFYGSGTPTLEQMTYGTSDVQSRPTRVTGPSPRTYNAATAYGKAIFTGPNEDTIISVDPTGAVDTLYRSAPAPVTVTGFALSAGRIVDADNQADSDHPDHVVSLRQHPVSSDGSTVSVGASAVIDPDNVNPPETDETWGPRQPMAASADTTAYLVQDPASGVDLRVLSPLGNQTVDDVEYFPLQVSGNRVLYYGEAAGANTAFLLDLTTDQTTNLTLTYQGIDFWLWGDYLVYRTADHLHQVTLSTGANQVIVDSPVESPREVGKYVVYDTGGRKVTILDVDAHTSSKFRLPKGTSALGLSDDGPIYEAPSGTIYQSPSRWFLHRWGGKEMPLIGSHAIRTVDQPQVAGRALAWIDPNDDLQVAPLDLTPLAPQSLGDAVTPATYNAAGPARWDVTIPYSEPLTSCAMSIRQGGATVRTLPCAPDQADLGVAAVSWDGKDSHGTEVTPGVYTWTVNAAGAGGAALDAAGTSARVSGTVAVT
jgi:hypothetical protein